MKLESQTRIFAVTKSEINIPIEPAVRLSNKGVSFKRAGVFLKGGLLLRRRGRREWHTSTNPPRMILPPSEDD